MSKGSEINVEIGLCTKDMAKENPIKDFEILVEEYKDKWSKQMYDYFKECLSIIEQELKEKKKYKDFVQEICNYIGLDNLFPYNDLKEIEKQIKTIADNSHWIAVKQDQKKLKALETLKNLDLFSVEQDENGLCWLVFAGQGVGISKEEYDLLKEVLL